MSCHAIEQLLPAYLENDLSAEDNARVRLHVDECADCGEALAAFRALEQSLSFRRQEVPDLRPIARAVFNELGLNPWHRVLRAALSLPALCSSAALMAALFFFMRKDSVVRTFSGDYGLAERISLLGEKVSQFLVTQTGGDVLILSGMYAAVTLMILLSTSMVVARFLRS